MKIPYHKKSRKEIDIVIEKILSKTNFLFVVLTTSFSLGYIPAIESQSNSLDSQIKIDSCLESINKNDLEKALKMCNHVVGKFPNHPEPLSDRSLIYTLLGEERLACLDVNHANRLIKNEMINIDPLIKYQMKVRYNSCNKR